MLSFRALVNGKFVQSHIVLYCNCTFLIEIYCPVTSTPEYPNNSSFEISCPFKLEPVIDHKLENCWSSLPFHIDSKSHWFYSYFHIYLLFCICITTTWRQVFITSSPDQKLLNDLAIFYFPLKSVLYPAIIMTFIPHTSDNFTFCSESFLGISLPISLYLNSSASFPVNLKPAYFPPSHFGCLKISLLFLMFTLWICFLTSLIFFLYN